MTTTDLTIGVAELRRSPGSTRELHLEVPAEALGGPIRNVDAAVVGDEPVTIDLRFDSSPGHIDAVGHIGVDWTGTCRRCLSEVAGSLDVVVDERFAERPELHPDHEAYPIVDDRIDLAPMVFELLILALPIVPLCGPECPGPDPDGHPIVVGDEERRGLDPRWAALDELR